MAVSLPSPPRADAEYDGRRRAALAHLLENHHDLLMDPFHHAAAIRAAVPEAVAALGREDPRLERDLLDAVLGAGELQRFLDDDRVTEIWVQDGRVFVVRDGKPREEHAFASREEAFRLAESMAIRMGERLQLARAIVDFAWIDGSRVNVVHPSLTDCGVAMTIRKPDRSRPLDLDALVAAEMLSGESARMLVDSVEARRNVLFTGAQNSGKTTLLRAVLHAVLAPHPMRRVIVIEDTPELRLRHPNLVSLRAREPAPGQSGAMAVDLAALTKGAKRESPELLVIGEVRGREGIDLIAAAQAEAAGVAGTLHISQPEDLVGRFYYFATQAELSITPEAMARWVYDSFHLVCHLDRDRDGRRRVVRIVSLDRASASMTDLYRAREARL